MQNLKEIYKVKWVDKTSRVHINEFSDRDLANDFRGALESFDLATDERLFRRDACTTTGYTRIL